VANIPCRGHSYADVAFALQGGFLPEMTRREASQILGIRETSEEQIIKDAHRRIMLSNHPDSGGSSYLATKINEAKDMLLGKRKSGPL
jgi:DnaJ homolog subfamily C member 19